VHCGEAGGGGRVEVGKLHGEFAVRLHGGVKPNIASNDLLAGGLQ